MEDTGDLITLALLAIAFVVLIVLLIFAPARLG